MSDDSRLRVCVVSHSLIAARQQYFLESLSKYCNVLGVSPEVWGKLHFKDKIISNSRSLDFVGIKVFNEGRIFDYFFPEEVFFKIKDFKPDWLYVMGEGNSAVVQQGRKWSDELNCRFSYFVWENINRIPRVRSDLVIAGSKEARELNDADVVLPQTGVNTSFFKPDFVSEKNINVLYVGREDVRKGTEMIKQAYPSTLFVSGKSYDELPKFFNRAKVVVSFPFDTPEWREQSGSYSIIESLSCEVPCVVSDCGAIPEYLSECAGVSIVKQKDIESLKKAINTFLNDDTVRSIRGFQGRKFIKEKYDNSVIAKKLVEAFKQYAKK